MSTGISPSVSPLPAVKKDRKMTRSCRGKPICMPGVPDDPRLQWSSLCTLDGFSRGVFKGDGHPPVVYLPNILEGVWKNGAGWPTANIMFPCTIFWPCCIWYDMFGKTLIHGQFQVENLKHPTHLSGFCAWFSVAYHIPVYKWSSIIMLQLDLAMVVIQSRRTYVASKSVGFSHVFYQTSLGMILQYSKERSGVCRVMDGSCEDRRFALRYTAVTQPADDLGGVHSMGQPCKSWQNIYQCLMSMSMMGLSHLSFKVPILSVAVFVIVRLAWPSQFFLDTAPTTVQQSWVSGRSIQNSSPNVPGKQAAQIVQPNECRCASDARSLLL